MGIDHMLRIGYHLSIAGSLDLAFDRATALDCTAMQIFVTNPQEWAIRKLSGNEQAEFISKYKNLDVKPVCVHMPYLPNLASSDRAIRKKSIESLSANIRICNQLGVKYLVAHLGSHMGKGKEKGIKNVVDALESVYKDIGDVMILLENQAGHINSVGARLEDLMQMYDKSTLASSGNLGFCLDTCHLCAANYDISDKEVLDGIDATLGFDKVRVFHINDAMFPLGSAKDRHENIGRGYIGIKGFRTLLNYKFIAKKALILETPQNGDMPEGEEIMIIRSLLER